MKKSNRLLNNFTLASHFFVHFFAITAWLWRESAQFFHFVEGKTQDNDFLFFSLNFDRVFRIQLQTNVLSDEWVHKEGRKKYFDSTRYNRFWVLGQGYQRWPYQGHKRLHISHVTPLARLLKQRCFGFLFCVMSGNKDQLSVFTWDNSKQ